MHTPLARSHSAVTPSRKRGNPRAHGGAANLFDVVSSAIALNVALRRVPVERQGAIARRWAEQTGLIG